MTTHALVLAAGLGRRLGLLPPGLPKGRIEFEGRSIVERSLDLLLREGIQTITIVTGYGHAWYASLAARYPTVRLIHNEIYDRSGSMHSLFLGLQAVSVDCLVLESDIVYEARALKALLEPQSINTVLVSGQTGLGDEVWIGSFHPGLISSVSKRPADHSGKRVGELVGISRIAPDIRSVLLNLYRNDPKHAQMAEYDSFGLHQAASTNLLQYTLVEDLVWGEIDDDEQYRLVRDQVVPKILVREMF